MERISNERVLEMIAMRRSLLATIRKRQLKYAGRSVRKGRIAKLVLEGKIPGKRQRGRRRNFLGGLASDVGCGEVGGGIATGGGSGKLQNIGSRRKSLTWNPKKKAPTIK